jgi:hypothetical protein
MEPTLPGAQGELFPEYTTTDQIRRAEDARVGYGNHESLYFYNEPTSRENTTVSDPYTVTRDRLTTRDIQPQRVNEWYLLVDRGRIIGLRMNGTDIPTDTISMQSEPGGLTVINMSVLITPGRDILGMTNLVQENRTKLVESAPKAFNGVSSKTRFIDV